MTKKPLWYQGKVADMLRAAGYLPVSRLWVTREQHAAIKAMAKQNEAHVKAVRAYVRELERKEKSEDKS